MHIPRWWWLPIVALALALAGSNQSVAQAAQAKHARVELLAETTSAKTGTSLWLGVHYSLEPGWHIYWLNPGDSGQPPTFDWRLPSGFSAGEIQWPRPQRLQSSAQVMDYGYRDDVLLTVPIHVPRMPRTEAATAQIVLNAKWLICREVCLPDRAQLHLSLPITSSTPTPGPAAGLFAAIKGLLPQPLPARWKARVESGKDDLVLTIDAGRSIARADFFPLDPGVIENAAPQRLRATASGTRITLKKSDLFTKPVPHLRGVLIVAGKTPYLVDAPVTQP